MFRSLSDIDQFYTDIDHKEILNIITSSDSVKEKFVVGTKFIYSSEKVDIGFTLLDSIKNIDTCNLINPSFVEELLASNPQPDEKTVKFIKFILANASRKEIFDMAIHQHMASNPQIHSQIQVSELENLLKLIRMAKYNLEAGTMEEKFLQEMNYCILKKISELSVPLPRDSESVKIEQADSTEIFEYYQNLSKYPICQNVIIPLFTQVIERIASCSDKDSPLVCLGLACVPDNMIENAVVHILNSMRYYNQKMTIIQVTGKLIVWQRRTQFKVPLHLWIMKVLQALNGDKQYEILEMIIFEHLEQLFIALIIPALQEKTFQVVRLMMEIQSSERIFKSVAPRLLKVLEQLRLTNSVIFGPLMDVVAYFISNFANVFIVCKDVVKFLELHHRTIDRRISKHRRLSSASSIYTNARVGLVNLGNTCYINSVLQALFMNKLFCTELLRTERSDRETMTVQKIFALLLFSDRSELDLNFAMQHIRPLDFLPGIQHDSSEFMGSLLDKLHEADKKYIQTITENGSDNDGAYGINDGVTLEMVEAAPINMAGGESDNNDQDQEAFDVPIDKTVDNTSELNQSTIVQKVFGGKISTTCECSSCKSKSISIDSFRDLALSFPEKEQNEDDWDAAAEYSVQELLNYYLSPEQLTLNGDNQYHCENCKRLCDGVRFTDLLQPPKNLILTLKHFRYDSRYHTRSKLLINKMFHDEQITVKVGAGPDARREVAYKLYAAVVHSGVSLDSGHYYTFAREKEQSWYKFNDSCVTRSTLHELHNLNSPNTPYILFYRRISTATSTASSSTATCAQAVSNEDSFPAHEDLPKFLQTFIMEDNEAYKKESSKKFSFQPNKTLAKSNRWNDDDPPPSSCGNNLNLQHNNFIF